MIRRESGLCLVLAAVLALSGCSTATAAHAPETGHVSSSRDSAEEGRGATFTAAANAVCRPLLAGQPVAPNVQDYQHYRAYLVSRAVLIGSTGRA